MIACIVMPETVFLLTKTHVSSYSTPFSSLTYMFGLSTRKSGITVQLLISKFLKNGKFHLRELEIQDACFLLPFHCHFINSLVIIFLCLPFFNMFFIFSSSSKAPQTNDSSQYKWNKGQFQFFSAGSRMVLGGHLKVSNITKIY